MTGTINFVEVSKHAVKFASDAGATGRYLKCTKCDDRADDDDDRRPTLDPAEIGI
jgi:hypothetical protein